MTGVELPQVSLQRYVDLVRRRRWQLLPVSVFGLLVGAVIAFLIPRYYVAETLIERSKIDGEFPGEDPLRSVVQSAQLIIPEKVAKALDRLRWPEWLAADPSERTQIEKEVRARIAINDTNPLESKREYVLIRVAYRDQNAARAADFTNGVVQTWIDDSVVGLRKSHEEQRQRANVEYSNWSDHLNDLLTEERDILQRFHIRADLDPSSANLEDQHRREDLRRDRDDLANKSLARTVLAEQIKKEQEMLGTMPERVPVTEANVLGWAKHLVAIDARPVDILVDVKQWSLWRESLDSINPDFPLGRRRVAFVKSVENRLLRLLEIDLDAKGEMPNREFALLTAKLAADRTALARLDVEVEGLGKRLAAQQEEQDNLPDGMYRLKETREKLRRADEEVKRQFGRLQEQVDILAALDARKPVQQVREAKPPPHPTDPNVFIVALIGAVLGLGIAVGLILLLDLLQGSFKTIEDVERGLGVPVLGGVSHLETEEERTTVARGRRRAAVAAFAFVALVVVVVTFYYVAPTRLPGIVRDLLRGLLGS